MKTWIDTDTSLEWLYDLDLIVTQAEAQTCPEEGNRRMATVSEVSALLNYNFEPPVKEGCPLGYENTWTSTSFKGDTYVFWNVTCFTGSVQPKDTANRRDVVYVREV